MVFDKHAAQYEAFADERKMLKRLLSKDEWDAAQRSTLNAHYTDRSYVRAIWNAVEELGFQGGTVLEPGCGSGHFLSAAPAGTTLVGIELDPITAQLAAMVHPQADIRNESFANTRIAEGAIDLVIGNVPFGDVTLHDQPSQLTVTQIALSRGIRGNSQLARHAHQAQRRAGSSRRDAR